MSKRYKCSSCERWHFSHASGYLIHASGLLVTNHHVVEGDEQGVIGAMLADGRFFGVERVLAASDPDDLVVMKLRGEGPFPALALGEAAATGERIYSLSHPDQNFYQLSEGIVARYFVRGGRPRMAVTADHARGSSGGPILDDRGHSRCGQT